MQPQCQHYLAVLSNRVLRSGCLAKDAGLERYLNSIGLSLNAIIPLVFSDPPLTKRQLGWLIISAGVTLALASLLVDVVGAGQFGGLGPAQLQAIGAGTLIILFGLTLLPLGNRPA